MENWRWGIDVEAGTFFPYETGKRAVKFAPARFQRDVGNNDIPRCHWPPRICSIVHLKKIQHETEPNVVFQTPWLVLALQRSFMGKSSLFAFDGDRFGFGRSDEQDTGAPA